MTLTPNTRRFALLAAWLSAAIPAHAELADTVAKVKPSVVGVGSYQRIRMPPVDFRGTGFVVGDGLHVLTNIHVLPQAIDRAKQETLAVFAREGGKETLRTAEVIDEDTQHDLALLKIVGPPLPTLAIGNSDKVREGETYAFTGFPIGPALGLHPATHRGMISAITPVATPALSARLINKTLFDRLQAPYDIFQLDATAYPGSSGSPLYNPETGDVIGIINKVFIQETKENLLTKPSGITYAIPIRYAEGLLRQAGRKGE